MRTYLSSVLLLITVLACAPQKNEQQQPVDLLPFDAQIVIQVNDPVVVENALTNNDFLGFTKKVFTTEAAQLQSLLPNTNTPFLVCASPIGKSAFALTSIRPLTAADTIPPKAVTSKTYDNIVISTLENELQPLYLARVGNHEVVSTSNLVVENSIRRFNSKAATDIEDSFKKQLEAINSDAAFNVLLHPDGANFFNPPLNNAPLFPKINSSWLGFDVSVEDPLVADGVAFLSDSIPDVMRLFKNLERQELQTPSRVPKSFSAYMAVPIANLEQLQDNLNYYNRIRNAPKLEGALSDWATVDELGLIKLGNGEAAILHRNNTTDNLEGLPAVGDYQYRNVSYGNQRLPQTWQQLLGILGSTQSMQWYAYFEDTVLFASDQATLKSLIGNFKDGNTLTNDPNFTALQNSLASEASFLWVLNTQSWASNTAVPFPVKSYPFIGLQASGSTDFMLLHLQVQPLQEVQAKNTVQQQYSLTLDAPAASPPQWLKNHRSKGMDIAIQDEQNVLYLFSNKGVLFWKKQLPGKILGPIVQVDLYKNKRLQMAFRTAERFMILDRNGKVVRPFDIKIPSGSSPQPLSVFDYDNSRDYRFVVNYGKTIRMYDRSGKIVKGFGLKSLPSPLQLPAQHLRFQRKDYLLFPLQNNTLKIVNRRGQDRVKVKEPIAFSANSFFGYLDTFTTTDSQGNLVQVDTKGNVIRVNLDLVAGHRIDATAKSLVTLSENILTIKGIPVQLPFGTYTPPKIFYINNTLYFSTTDTEAQKVYLFYSNGKAVGGFPVYGTSSADVNNADNDKNLELTVSAEDNGVLIYQFTN